MEVGDERFAGVFQPARSGGAQQAENHGEKIMGTAHSGAAGVSAQAAI
jgi:hypothetical protein